MLTVGSYEAKTHLPRILERVIAGEQVTITRHGTPIARIVPISPSEGDRLSAIADLKACSRGVRLDGLNLREMIEEGRRDGNESVCP